MPRDGERRRPRPRRPDGQSDAPTESIAIQPKSVTGERLGALEKGVGSGIVRVRVVFF